MKNKTGTQQDTGDRDLSVDQDSAVRKIRFLIDTHQETVPGLARGIGVLPGTIQDVLDGQCHASHALVRRIADRFSLPLEFFSGDVPKEREVSPRSNKTSVSSPTTRAQRVETPSTVHSQSHDSTLDELILSQKALVSLLQDKGLISSSEWQARLRSVRATKN